MRRTLASAVLLAVTALAAADVRVFVTTSSAGYGLTIPANHNVPTYSEVDANNNDYNAYDYYYGAFQVAAFPPEAAPSGTIENPVEIIPGDWAYIWLQFQNESRGSEIYGLIVNITGPTGFSTTYYVQNDKGNLADSQKRWDGTATAPDYPEWHNNPQTMLADTANGLINGYDDPEMMFDSQSGTNPRTGVALVGAIDDIGPGTYEINFTALTYLDPPFITIGGVFQMVPEPASMLLLGLVSLLLRRR